MLSVLYILHSARAEPNEIQAVANQVFMLTDYCHCLYSKLQYTLRITPVSITLTQVCPNLNGSPRNLMVNNSVRAGGIFPSLLPDWIKYLHYLRSQNAILLSDCTGKRKKIGREGRCQWLARWQGHQLETHLLTSL